MEIRLRRAPITIRRTSSPHQEFITVPVLESVPDVHELGNTMIPQMVGVNLCIVPGKSGDIRDAVGGEWRESTQRFCDGI